MRPLWLAGGIAAIGLATVGAVLPVLPTVPFLLLAAFCFGRSNPAWERRLLAHPRYGPPLRAWRERRAIARRAKLAALAAMAGGIAFTAFVVGPRWALAPAAILLVVGPWIWTRAE